MGAPLRVRVTIWNNSLKGDEVKLCNHIFNVKPEQIGLKLQFSPSLKGLVRVWTNLFFGVKVNLKGLGLGQHFLGLELKFRPNVFGLRFKTMSCKIMVWVWTNIF